MTQSDDEVFSPEMMESAFGLGFLGSCPSLALRVRYCRTMVAACRSGKRPEFTWSSRDSSRCSMTVACQWTTVGSHRNSAEGGLAPALQTPEILSPCAFDRSIPSRGRHRATWFVTRACDRAPFESVVVGRTVSVRCPCPRQTFVQMFERSCTSPGLAVRSVCRNPLEEGAPQPPSSSSAEQSARQRATAF